jgi:hypothetical protein
MVSRFESAAQNFSISSARSFAWMIVGQEGSGSDADSEPENAGPTPASTAAIAKEAANRSIFGLSISAGLTTSPVAEGD